jgi:hypothetical protein
LETKEILRIIRACSAYGVSEFADGSLKITFSQTKSNNIPDKAVVTPPKTMHQMELIAQAEDEKNHIKELQDETDNLVLTDPLAYEEQLASGDLVDEPQLRYQ